MILEHIDQQLEKLYCTSQLSDSISIGTWYYIEGDPINFQYYQEDEKFSRIVTNRNFSEWIAWHTDGWRKAAPVIRKIVEPYGVQWDNEDGRLYIRFHRNEMTLAQAIMRLQQAVFVIGAIEYF